MPADRAHHAHGPDSEVGLAQRSIFGNKIMIRSGGRWGAPGRPPASGIDAGWSPGMPGTMFEVSSALPTGL